MTHRVSELPIDGQRTSRDWGVLSFIAVVLYLAFRLPWITSIPPYTFDEGLLALPAKNWLAFGDPLFGQNLDFLRFPLFTAVLAGAFGLFGHTILVSRLLSVAAGVASLLLFTSIARKLLGSAAAKWAVFLFALDFVLIRYQRYGLAESVQILLILATVAAWVSPRARRSVIASALLSASLLHKPTSLQVIPALLWLDFIATNRGGPIYGTITPHISRRRLGVSYLEAAGVVALVHVSLWGGWPSGFTGAWRLYAESPFQISDVPRTLGILLLGSPLAVLGSLAFLFRRSARPDERIVFVQVWLVTGLLFLMSMRVHPVRYFSTLLPPAILLGAAFLARLSSAVSSRLAPAGSPQAVTRVTSCVLAVVVALHTCALFTVVYFVKGDRDSSARELATWMRLRVPSPCVVLGSPQLGVDIPNPFIDMTSIKALRLSRTHLREYRVAYVLYDAVEWGALSEKLGLAVQDSLRQNCILIAQIGSVEVWEVLSGAEREDTQFLGVPPWARSGGATPITSDLSRRELAPEPGPRWAQVHRAPE